MIIIKLIWNLLGIAYFPIYLTAWFLLLVFRILLAITYVLMLDFTQAKNIVRYTFTPFSYDSRYRTKL